MSTKGFCAVLAAGAALALAGCGPKGPPPTIHQSMAEVIQPQAQTVWDITSRAFNDVGDGYDARKLSAGDWAKMESAGKAIEKRAKLLDRARRVVVAGPDEIVMGSGAAPPGPTKRTWDAASAAQIQRLIAANPAKFHERMGNLAKVGGEIASASRRRDVAALYRVTSNLDEDCDSCHQPFWGTDEPPPFPKGT